MIRTIYPERVADESAGALGFLNGILHAEISEEVAYWLLGRKNGAPSPEADRYAFDALIQRAERQSAALLGGPSADAGPSAPFSQK